MENNNSQKPLVAVWSLVYNHEPYLRDYFEGIIMQKTDFPFIAIVHDDCSTDCSAAIIREYAEKYPDIIKPIFETENQYSKKDGSLDRIMHEAINASGAKYIALCEGDDYWIDPLKLQKQVDYLENNPDVGMCYSMVNIKSIINDYSNNTQFGYDRCNFIDILLKGNPIPTLTVTLRLNIYNSYFETIKPQTKNWLAGDYPLWLYIAAISQIRFQNESFGIYREIAGSASHSTIISKQINFAKSIRDIRLFFNQRYNSNDIMSKQKITYSYLKRLVLLHYKNKVEKELVFEEIKQNISCVNWKQRLIIYLSVSNIFNPILKRRTKLKLY